MVAGHDDDLVLAAQPLAERAQDRLGDLHRLSRATLRQFDDVAEEHETLDAVEGVEQRIERLIVAQDVAAQAGAEVQIGDDERGHAGATMAQAAPTKWCPGRTRGTNQLRPRRQSAAAVRARSAMKHAVRVPQPQAGAADHRQQHSLPPFTSCARGPPP